MTQRLVDEELLRKVLVVLAEVDSRNALDIWDVSDALRAVLAQPAPHLVPRMSQPNREVAYSACAALRGVGYVWDEKQRHWAAPQAQEKS